MLTLATTCALFLASAPQLESRVEPIENAVKTGGEPCCDPRIPIDAVHTPGDADSLFRITRSGSYYLPENVEGVPDKSGIEIAASDVSVDLMGFTLRGVRRTLTGILADGDLERVQVQNGIVTGFSGTGVSLSTAKASRVEDLRVSHNGNLGIVLGTGGTVLRCTVTGSAGNGFVAYEDSIVADCVSIQNGGNGFWLDGRVLAERCQSSGNQLMGFRMQSRSTAQKCTATLNTQSGFLMSNGSSAYACTSNENMLDGFDGATSRTFIQESTARANGEWGIRIQNRSYLNKNVVQENGAVGVGGGIRVVGTANVLDDNTVTHQDAFGYLVNGTDNFLRSNRASNNAFNWSVAADNACHVLTASTAGPFFGDFGGAAVGPYDPNANYTF